VNIFIHRLTVVVLTIVVSLGTTVAIVCNTVLLCAHAMERWLNQDFSAGIGAIAILGYTLPFVFLTSLLITLELDLSQTTLQQELSRWLGALVPSLLASTILIGGGSALLYGLGLAIAPHFSLILLIGLGFPALSLWFYYSQRVRGC